MTNPDEEALSWAGDADPADTISVPEPTAAGEAEGASPPMSSALLLTLGILMGVYLLYTVGWVITTQRNAIVLPGLLDQVMFQAREFFAVMAPAVWFTSVLLLTRDCKPIIRLAWLLVGVVVLVPLPFVLGV